MTYVNWKGTTTLAWQTVNEMKGTDDPEPRLRILFQLNCFDRNFVEALRQLKSLKREYANNYDTFIPTSQKTAFVYRCMGRSDVSMKFFDSSRVQLEKMLQTSPEDYRLHRSLSVSYAGLGKKDKALSEHRRAMELVPAKNTNLRTVVHELDLTQIYMLLGDHENALKQIEERLSRPAMLSVNGLKLDPLFDPLRNLPGYKAIIEKYSGAAE